MLSTTNLSIQFEAKPLFEHVSVKFSDGNRYGLIGANGSGKSMLASAICGAVALSSGRLTSSATSGVGVLDQGRSQVPRGDICLADWFPEASEMPPSDARTLLAKFGLGNDDVGRPLSTLSEGERTRVGLALLASRETTGLILDEPTAGVDIEVRRTMWDFLRQINEVTHAIFGNVKLALLLVNDPPRRFEFFEHLQQTIFRCGHSPSPV